MMGKLREACATASCGGAWGRSYGSRSGAGRHTSPTWHVKDGVALVHGEHVGTRANVHARVLGLDVLDGQDPVKVHGPVGQLPVTHPGPDQRVSRRLWQSKQTCEEVGGACGRSEDGEDATLLLAVQMKLTVDPTRTV